MNKPVTHWAWTGFLTMILLAGCAISSPQIAYYSLYAPAQTAAPAPAINPLAVSVGPVTIPDILKHTQIATGGADGRYLLSEDHRWSGELGPEFARADGRATGRWSPHRTSGTLPAGPNAVELISSSGKSVNAPNDIAVSDGDLTLANINAQVADVLRTDIIADSIPTTGSLPTLEQAIYTIHQFLMEKSVSSTTLTVNKADGATSLLTFTLDSATDPTSITRAT